MLAGHFWLRTKALHSLAQEGRTGAVCKSGLRRAVASMLDLPGSTLEPRLEKHYSTVQESLKVPHFKAKSPKDCLGGSRGSEHTTHSALHQPDIPCTEEKPGLERNSGAAWHGGNGTEKTSWTLGVNAGNEGRGISSLDSLPLPDCSNAT